MDPRFVEKPAFIIAGVTAVGQPAQLNYGEIWEKRYMPLDPALKPLSPDGGYYGATFVENGAYVYLAGMAVKDGAWLPEGAEIRPVPAARYAVFDCALDAIGPTWKEAYEAWLPSSAYALDTSSADFEYYPPCGPDGVQKVEIHIPVKAK